jgi:hypothetical protein
MAGDQFENQLNWIKGLTGEDRSKASSVVAWQCIATTNNELVKRFNDFSFGRTEQQSKHNYEVQLKKVIIGTIYELNDCFHKWTAYLRRQGLFHDKLKCLKQTFEDTCRTVGLSELKEIRNGVAFHFKEFLTDADAIIELYTNIDQIPREMLSKNVIAGHACGYAMRDKVVKTLSTAI